MRRIVALSTAALALLAAGCKEEVVAPVHVACDPFLTGFQQVVGDTATSEIGAEYFDVRTGADGIVADIGTTVDVNYSLYDLESQLLDSSCPLDRTVIQFTVGTNQILPGFQDGLRGMRIGGLRRIVLPPELGYPPNADPAVASKTLIFDVQMVGVRR